MSSTRTCKERAMWDVHVTCACHMRRMRTQRSVPDRVGAETSTLPLTRPVFLLKTILLFLYIFFKT